MIPSASEEAYGPLLRITFLNCKICRISKQNNYIELPLSR
jgi:hypothetical protein